jgi:hypothetical protein
VKTIPTYTPSEPAIRDNGQQSPMNGGFGALLEETQALQNTLRDALARTTQLLIGLKGYRRQAKALKSTLNTLKQLQQVEA